LHNQPNVLLDQEERHVVFWTASRAERRAMFMWRVIRV